MKLNRGGFEITDKECSDYLNEESDKKLGIDKDGHYKDYNGCKYHGDQDYLTLQKFYLTGMKPTKDDYNFLKLYYIETVKEYNNKKPIKYDYSFIKSLSIRHLLLNESLPEKDTNDPYFVLLNYAERTKIYKLIELLEKTENWDLKFKIIDRINELQPENYIITEWENNKLFILNLIRNKES
jgi:hypothetical protein